MELGAFSVSLNVKDIAESRRFYEILGFDAVSGSESENWLIMANGERVIGLFQNMFEKNTLTFCPGWDQKGENLPEFDDIRLILSRLKDAGVEIHHQSPEIEGNASGPANFITFDPDGNPILFDQHI